MVPLSPQWCGTGLTGILKCPNIVDGSEYQPDLLRVRQASPDRYQCQKIIWHPSSPGESSRSPTDYKFQGKMSIIPRQRKTVQQSSAVHLSKQRIFLELRKIR